MIGIDPGSALGRAQAERRALERRRLTLALRPADAAKVPRPATSPRPSRPECGPFAAHVRQAREERGWTLAEMERRLGSDGTVFHWEAARTLPTDALLVRLAKVLDVPVAELAVFVPTMARADGSAAERIRAARWARYESQSEFAGRLGVSAVSVRQWESGSCTPGVDAARALKVAGVDDVLADRPPVTPVPYFGTKAAHVDRLLGMLPALPRYVEPFGGSGTVLFSRDAADFEVYNDLDGRLSALFGVLRDPEAAARLKVRLERTLYSRAEYLTAVRFLKARGGTTEDVAWAMFVLLGQSTNGQNFAYEANWAAPVTGTRVAGWWKRVAWVDTWHERLSHVAVECDDALKVIARYDTPDTAFYLDPPYPQTSTVRARSYVHGFASDRHHHNLVDVLLDTAGAVVLCGYRCEPYRRLEQAGWQVDELGKDSVWRNPRCLEAA